jgi:ankyrin repeat protein
VPTSPDEALAMIVAIHGGDEQTVLRLVAENPAVASSRLGGIAKGRTALHIVADWPGYFPNGPRIARLLIDAGADVNDRGKDGEDGEAPLHWAASSDDVDVAAVLIDGGADIEMPNGSIGTPLDNAIGYACWNVARLLVAKGARVDKLWHAAALGLLDRLEELLAEESLATPERIDQAFWHACGGNQRRAAELLLDRGAHLNWVPDYAEGTALDAAHGSGTRQNNVIEWLESRGALSSDSIEAGGT